MRKILFLICVLGFSIEMRAQSNVGSWSNLGTLRQGEKIQVRETTRTKLVGKFVSFSETSITVETQAGPQTLQQQQIRTVKRMRVKHRWVNSLLVGGAGAGIGYGIGRSQYHPCPNTQTFCLDIGGDVSGDVGLVTGFLGGAAVGALLPLHETVYSLSSH